jgi:hypothetical protein
MSSGQKPRWPQYFPRMKRRGKHRKRGARMVLWNSAWNPIWPPVLRIDGHSVDIRKPTLIINGRALDRATGYWEDQP